MTTTMNDITRIIFLTPTSTSELSLSFYIYGARARALGLPSNEIGLSRCGLASGFSFQFAKHRGCEEKEARNRRKSTNFYNERDTSTNTPFHIGWALKVKLCFSVDLFSLSATKKTHRWQKKWNDKISLLFSLFPFFKIRCVSLLNPENPNEKEENRRCR